MLRIVAVSLITCALIAPSHAQAPAAQPASTAAKPAAKKAVPKAKAKAAKPAASGAADTGPCDMGVISHLGDVFTVQKVGLTVFGNEYAEVQVPWGLDDLIFARVKAAGGAGVRRINYAKDAFDAYNKPKLFFLREENEKLPGVIRQIAGSAGCRRYLVIMPLTGQLPGTNQTLTGVGIVNHGTSILSYSAVFAFINVVLLDGNTFETLGNPNVNLKRVLGNMAEDLVKARNMQKVDNTAFPATPSDAAKSTTLRDLTRAMLTERLDKDIPAYFKADEQ
jgi:hypothetical protein